MMRGAEEDLIGDLLDTYFIIRPEDGVLPLEVHLQIAIIARLSVLLAVAPIAGTSVNQDDEPRGRVFCAHACIFPLGWFYPGVARMEAATIDVTVLFRHRLSVPKGYPFRDSNTSSAHQAHLYIEPSPLTLTSASDARSPHPRHVPDRFHSFWLPRPAPPT